MRGTHITCYKKIRSANYALAQCKNKLPLQARLTIFRSLVQSYLGWGSAIFGATRQSEINKLEAAQNKAFRNALGLKFNAHTIEYYSEYKILKAQDLMLSTRCLFAFKQHKGFMPNSFNKHFHYSYEQGDREKRDSCLNFSRPLNVDQGSEIFPLAEIIKA